MHSKLVALFPFLSSRFVSGCIIKLTVKLCNFGLFCPKKKGNGTKNIFSRHCALLTHRTLMFWYQLNKRLEQRTCYNGHSKKLLNGEKVPLWLLLLLGFITVSHCVKAGEFHDEMQNVL